MPTLIIVRLRPSEPTTGAAFTNALSGLTISAYDLTFDDTVDGVLLGSASGVFTSSTVGDDTVDVENTGIIQHYTDVVFPSAQRFPAAAATAVIVANPPGGHHEYPASDSFDLRLVLDRGGPIADHRIDVNAAVVNVSSPLSNDQNDYLAMAPSAYATIPAANLGVGGHLDMPEDGTPPNFTALVQAVDAVLALDPADGQTLAQRDQLTVAQARQIATELVWDRIVAPPPEEPRPLAEMYTSPPDNTSIDADEAENDRRKFEALLDAYYATHDAEALRLAGFVFAASAAMVCERLSAGESVPGPLGTVDGTREALLTFPLITGASDQTTLTHAAVLLTGSPAGSVLNPAFVVPAAHFYALDAQLPPQVDAAQRFAMARASAEEKALVALQAAVESGVIAATESPVAAAVPATPVGVPQTARRLRAIGQADNGAPQVPVAAPVTTLIDGWLAYAGQTGAIDADFWTPTVAVNPGAGAYLNLLLHVITDNFDPLIATIQAPPLSVSSVADLVAVTDQ
ncbi:MAG TPA: insecticidal toxin complex protein, partial [Pseudonocardiaceae bacterium]|nr:insecticidal toxin complex protein [Pseudonocardiaceae bacterium]